MTTSPDRFATIVATSKGFGVKADSSLLVTAKLAL